MHFAEDFLEVEEISDIYEYLKEKEQIYTEKYKDRYKIKFNNFCGYFGNKLVIQKKLAKKLNLIDKDENLKINYKKTYNEIFQNFLERILLELSKEHIIYSLSLSNFSVKENKLNENKIFKLLLLLELKDELMNSLQLILSNPHRKLCEYKTYNNLDEVDYIDSNVIMDILQNPNKLYKTEKGILEYNNVKYLPVEVLQYKQEENFDTLENRFIKFFLKELENILLNDLKEFMHLESLKKFQEEIEFILRSDIFLEIKNLSYFPSNSQILMRREGYREIFEIYRLLHLSFIPKIFEDLDLSFSLKDMATLWEYYTLIEILKELKDEFGNYQLKIDFKEKAKYKTNYEEAKFEFEKGLIVYYQKTFNGYSTLQFRPDFYIKYDNKEFIFDAKFRLFEDNKTDILKNMHYYKDSLRVKFAVAVCLGDKKNGRFWKIDGDMKIINFFLDCMNKEDLKGVGYLDLKI